MVLSASVVLRFGEVWLAPSRRLLLIRANVGLWRVAQGYSVRIDNRRVASNRLSQPLAPTNVKNLMGSSQLVAVSCYQRSGLRGSIRTG